MVVDKKIQKVVEELKALPHEVLIRYLTYWSEAIDSRKYVVESDPPHEEWYTDCCDYAASETYEERYMHAKCMVETLGHMLQDIKNNYHNKYLAAMRTVKLWKNYLIKDYQVTEKRGDVILCLPEVCKDSPFNNLMDKVYGRWMTASE